MPQNSRFLFSFLRHFKYQTSCTPGKDFCCIIAIYILTEKLKNVFTHPHAILHCEKKGSKCTQDVMPKVHLCTKRVHITSKVHITTLPLHFLFFNPTHIHILQILHFLGPCQYVEMSFSMVGSGQTEVQVMVLMAHGLCTERKVGERTLYDGLCQSLPPELPSHLSSPLLGTP